MSNSHDRGALALMPMGHGYSIILLPGGMPPAAGNTNGRMYNSLQELQEHLRSMNVRDSDIPKADFSTPITVEL
jgi:hypothetical protein